MRTAIIGCGAVAQVHAKAIAAAPGGECRLAAAADLLPERATALVRLYEEETKRLRGQYAGDSREAERSYAPRIYSDWREMLEREQIDVVHICTPHALHAPMALEAMERGCHVFLEKPPALSPADWAALKNVSRDKGRRLAVCFQNRFNLSTQKAREILQSGVLGRLLGARGIVTWKRNAPYYTESPWRGRRESEGGSALINQAIHTLDLVQYLGEEQPSGVSAVMGNLHLRGVIETEDTASLYIEYPSKTASFYATTGYCEDAPVLIDLVCERGHLRLEGDEVSVRRADGSSELLRLSSGAAPGKGYWGNGHVSAILGFYRAIRENAPFLLDPDQVDASVRLMLGAYASAQSGQRVSLDEA